MPVHMHHGPLLGHGGRGTGACPHQGNSVSHCMYESRPTCGRPAMGPALTHRSEEKGRNERGHRQMPEGKGKERKGTGEKPGQLSRLLPGPRCKDKVWK